MFRIFGIVPPPHNTLLVASSFSPLLFLALFSWTSPPVVPLFLLAPSRPPTVYPALPTSPSRLALPPSPPLASHLLSFLGVTFGYGFYLFLHLLIPLLARFFVCDENRFVSLKPDGLSRSEGRNRNKRTDCVSSGEVATDRDLFSSPLTRPPLFILPSLSGHHDVPSPLEATLSFRSRAHSQLCCPSGGGDRQRWGRVALPSSGDTYDRSLGRTRRFHSRLSDTGAGRGVDQGRVYLTH